VLKPELTGELRHVAVLVGGQQRDADAGPSRTTGAADAVHVRLAVRRWIEVDHVRDPVDVDPARRDVGGDERVDGA
jgi:hypothetical protein